MSSLRVFISSVQNELEHERAAVAQIVTVDPFLLRHCEPVLYEKDPSTGRPSQKGYLDRLAECQIYLLLVDVEYGRASGDLSATHEEYRQAQQAKLPTLVFIRGLDRKRDAAREARTREFIEEIKRDGHKYGRFHDREDLKPSVRAGLYAVLEKQFRLKPSQEDSDDGDHLIEVASPFESAPILDASADSFAREALAPFVEAVIPEPGMRIWEDAPTRPSSLAVWPRLARAHVRSSPEPPTSSSDSGLPTAFPTVKSSPMPTTNRESQAAQRARRPSMPPSWLQWNRL